MITRPKKQLCSSCGCWFKPADLHPVAVDGKTKLFCYRCPSPIEIRQRCSKIQSTWSDRIEHTRRSSDYEPWHVPTFKAVVWKQ